MDVGFQTTLFAPPATATPAGIERRALSAGAWVDVARGWLPDADDVFATLVSAVPWRAERRAMYDRVVDVPRLVHSYMIGDELPHPALTAAREALSAHYLPELGEPFRTAGCCYYRDGRDSVAWHGDTIGRGSTHDTMVAIVSVGDNMEAAGIITHIWVDPLMRSGTGIMGGTRATAVGTPANGQIVPWPAPVAGLP